MQRPDPARPRFRRLPHWLSGAALALAVAAVAILGGSSLFVRHYTDRLAQSGEGTLRLAVAAIGGELGRFERLPPLIADRSLIRQALADPTPARLAETNAYLAAVNGPLGTTDIYLMRPDGLTIAASNHASPNPFTGQNFAFRPYFTEAMQGRTGRFFGLGTTSLRRGYYFASPVHDGGRITGAVAIKVDVEGLERAWDGADYEVTVTDPEGIVFLSSRGDWLFGAFGPLTAETLRAGRETRRYANAVLHALPVTQGQDRDGHALMTTTDGRATHRYLVLSAPMAELGWTVRVLLDLAPVRAQAASATLILMLISCLFALFVAVMLERRRRLGDRIRLQAEAQAALEGKVAERTSELAAVNAALGAEVAERRAAEEKLRLAQRRLVQSGKLAALGQMSATLSHELSQPIGAVRNFAENAGTYIDRGRIPEARENVGRIVALADRMTEIGRSLRSFARQPGEKLVATDAAEAVREALAVLRWRLDRAGIAVSEATGTGPAPVMAGPVRLQQVLVNLLSNAADSLEAAATPAPALAITLERGAGRVLIRVADNGPGVEPAMEERIFDPFFTTKGKGLGLGLSISYNIVRDFGGELRLLTRRAGACFEIELAAAPADGAVPAGEDGTREGAPEREDANGGAQDPARR
ncbi:sensor histidine kinase [Frigidibacter sp. MR17.24]|uniref:sensor histidine kinase n=1 Tax=Frigidibacter sp. MR17.24 TaxID=3127345 RepID=UPI00301302D1